MHQKHQITSAIIRDLCIFFVLFNKYCVFCHCILEEEKRTRAKNGTLASIQDSVDIKNQHFFEWKNCFVSLLAFHYGSFDFVN